MACDCCTEPPCAEPILETEYKRGDSPLIADDGMAFIGYAHFHSDRRDISAFSSGGFAYVDSYDSVTDADFLFGTVTEVITGLPDPYMGSASGGSLTSSGAITKTTAIDPDTGTRTSTYSGTITATPSDGSPGSYALTQFLDDGGAWSPPLPTDSFAVGTFDRTYSDKVDPVQTYHFLAQPSASAFYKIWWDTRGLQEGTGDHKRVIDTDKTFSVTPTGTGNICIPAGVDLSDSSTWPETDDNDSDKTLVVENVRWSCVDGYMPDDTHPSGYPA